MPVTVKIPADSSFCKDNIPWNDFTIILIIIFILNSHVPSHYTRSSNLFHLFSHTTLRSFDISIIGLEFWNTLLSHVKSCLTLSPFKLKSKMLLLNERYTDN